MSNSLTQSHPAVKLLVKKLNDGTLTGDEKPAFVHASDPVFAKTDPKCFRNCLKNTKKRLGLGPNSNKLLDDEAAEMNRRCTEDLEDGARKKRKVGNSSDVEELDSDNDFGSELLVDQYSFRPMVSFSVWTEPPTTTKRLTVAIVLPTGIEVNDFSVHVVCGGEFLEFKCLWPKEVVDVEILHRKWLLSEKDENRIESYHPKILGFESFFKNMRKRATDSIQSVCRIPLPFVVETHIYSGANLQWRNSTTRVAYIELRSSAEEYGIKNETEFELV